MDVSTARRQQLLDRLAREGYGVFTGATEDGEEVAVSHPDFGEHRHRIGPVELMARNQRHVFATLKLARAAARAKRA